MGTVRRRTEMKQTSELRSKLSKLWIEAAAHDGIDPTSMFIVFSKSNPFIVKYNALALKISKRMVR
jgi:hypothetical protein